jgi:regulator of sigma E protease
MDMFEIITIFNMLLALIGILAAITVLIGVHEAGHFVIAKLMGVKVLRFSIGFGKPLWRFCDKSGTEYVIAAIPLGGYVKLLDENNEVVLPADQAFAFNRQPLWSRFLIVAAGPVSNILLAILVYWMSYCLGVVTNIPLIGTVEPQSIAARAGLRAGQEIVSVDKHSTKDWQDVMMGLIRHLGEGGKLEIAAKQSPLMAENTSQNYTLDLTSWVVDELRPEILQSLGIKEYEPQQPAIIEALENNGPAQLAGFKLGDQLLSVNRTAITNWKTLTDYIIAHPNQTVMFTLKRQQSELILPVKISQTSWLTHKVGHLGVEGKMTPLPPTLQRVQQYSIGRSMIAALNQVTLLVDFNLLIIKKMLSGAISLKSLGGPISLLQGAAIAAQYGIVPYLIFLGFMSIGLAIINVLPIPGLDGGYLFYFLWEAISRRPVSKSVQLFALRLGVILLFILMVQALTNDIMRW